MSFLGTYSALSKNGYQSLGGNQWQLTQVKGPFTFGVGQPAFSADGNYLAIYTIYDNVGTGAVYIYYNGGSGTNWSLQQTIVGTQSNQEFGNGLSFSDDGSYLAIGAPGETSAAGAVHIYIRSGTTWTLQQRIVASDAATGDRFGEVVSLSGNAGYIAIGSPSEDTAPTTNNGAAYVFIRSGTSWTQQQKILAPIGYQQTGAGFANTLEISQDGLYLIIGSPFFDSPASDSGIAVIYKRTGTTWAYQNILLGPGTSGARFGRTVNISNDGSLVCVRAEGQRLIYFYKKPVGGIDWNLLQSLTYATYSPTTISNSTAEGTAMQGSGINIILGLGVNDRVIAVDNTSQSYQIEQELFSGVTPVPQNFGAAVAIARTANICAVNSSGVVGSSNSIYIFIKQ